MIVLAPAAMAARKGASSTRSRCARSLGTRSGDRDASRCWYRRGRGNVSRWPGRRFPRRRARTPRQIRRRAPGSSPNERVLMMGFCGIAVHVGVGRENPGHAHGSRFESRNFSHRVGVFRAARRGDGHGVGERRALLDAHGRAALEIRADQQRNFRVALQRVDQHRGRIHLAALHAERRALRLDRERADVLFLDIAEKILVVLAFGGKERAVSPDGEKLPDFFIERHVL